MKQIFRVLLALLVFLVLWIDLPENFKVGNYTVNPLRINARIFGKEIKKDFKTRLGLDLKGGSHLVFQADTSKLKSTDVEDALSSARDIIEKRVNFFGVSEPNIQVRKSGNIHRIVVELPGITNVSEAVARIGKIAQLSFREEASTEAKVATDQAIPLVFKSKPSLVGKDIKKATVQFDPQTGKPQVGLEFTGKGAKAFEEATGRTVGKQIGIFLDEMIVSAPVVQQKITGGTAVITGDFTLDEAKALAQDINAGALPVPIKLEEIRNIGPTLGEAEVKKSVFAGVVGLSAVILFMILYYRKLGLIASLALVIYGLISLAIFRAIPVVLTLSGVAGFLLSIGMAVDSNILIFERIREELRSGKSFETAFRLGFGRAIDAIKDANITTIIVALILFNPLNWNFLPQFGLVRGFALTLMIGVATSLFTGVFITKRLISIFYKNV